MRRLTVLALLLGLLLPAAASAAARVPYGFFGFTVEGALFSDQVNQKREFGAMTKAGAESVLTEVNWHFMQPEQDQPVNFARIDEVVGNAAARGMRAMTNVLYTPPWARTDRDSFASPPQPMAYAAFMRELVLRYGPKGTFWAENPRLPKLPIRDWQVWNEPSAKGFWSVQPWAEDYVELLRWARLAIKDADPGARVVLAGLTYRSWQDLQKIYKAGGANLFDVVSLHPYTKQPKDVNYIIGLVRKVMARNGDARMPVLVTELSWPTAAGRPNSGYGYEVTPKQQARNIAEVIPYLVGARKRLRIEAVYWHSWLSTDSGRATFDYSGLRRVRGAKITDKPGLAAWRRVTLRYEGCKRKGGTAKRCG